jgi:membrane protease YdiL (CAAX protease family)
VIGYARANNLWIVFVILIVNGIAEELFFRGAVRRDRRTPSRADLHGYLRPGHDRGWQPVLVFAAAVLGTVVGLQRRAGGGVLAPILTHLTWSSAMLFALPPIFAGFS